MQSQSTHAIARWFEFGLCSVCAIPDEAWLSSDLGGGLPPRIRKDLWFDGFDEMTRYVFVLGAGRHDAASAIFLPTW